MIRQTVCLAALALTLCGCATVEPAERGRLVASARLQTAQGNTIGTALLLESGAALALAIELRGLAAGAVHGVHLHAVGQCDAPAFTSAGPHLNPQGHQHGSDNPAGSHLGDLPNLALDAAGNASVRLDLAGAAPAVLPQILDADGTALVIHAAADDYRTDPSGNSGARIACGVLERPTG